jgi:hypothetical protein
MPVGNTQKFPPFFPYVQKNSAPPRSFPRIGMTRDRISAGKRMSRIADVYPAMPRKSKVEAIL